MSTVRIADLKAHLSEYLRSVRAGETVTVLDRSTPVARLVPYEADALELRRATRSPSDLRLPPPPKQRSDSLAVLLADRATR